MPDRKDRTIENKLYSEWRATTDQINQLPKAEHGGFLDPKKRDELAQKRNDLLKIIPEGTFPSL